MVEKKIQLKLFVGCLITSEIKILLDHSPLWKQAKIVASTSDLVEIHYHDKNYIGFYLPENKTTLSSLKLAESKILTALKLYIPLFSSEKFRILVFSQVFNY